MCTAITYQPRELYMGRSLDYEASYGEEIVMLPRRFPLRFRHGGGSEQGYAILGTAHVADGYPLYYDAVNEKGLGIAGLNFVGNARYAAPQDGRQNVAQFEFIPWLLRQCATLAEARQLLQAVNLTGTPFSAHFPAAQLHWLLADATGALTLEPTAAGLQIYENPVGVLTNNPPFPQQLFALNNYMHLSPRQPENTFAPDVPLQAYSRGMGALGLPGDLSSPSRFVRAAFVRANARAAQTEDANVSQFFHILTSVEQQRGCCELDDGQYEITLYSSCCNADQGIYYYTTYDNRQITGVKLHAADLDSARLTAYPLVDTQQIRWEN